ncbi:MAG: pectate lyase [Bacteroidetes bacterium]|nr:pectate lyase [Bacteroidota bacterium]
MTLPAAIRFCFVLCASLSVLTAQGIGLNGFQDGAHHWYDITDEVPKLIVPVKDQPRYDKEKVTAIADNILLYQRDNGGWPKNYDMTAVLTDSQRTVLLRTKHDISLTTFDNGATHAQIAYLAAANQQFPDARYRDAVVRGIEFILTAQYPNGGFPQFFPDTSGYRKYITYNDGAMLGVVRILQRITDNSPHYAFIEPALRSRAAAAFRRALDCIVRTQIRVNGSLTAWCQQHDHRTLEPQNARTFEPKAICSMESAEIVEFLMRLRSPDTSVIAAVNGAVRWFRRSGITGIRVETVKAEKEKFIYHTSEDDRRTVRDPAAPVIWTRMYEIPTNRPMFCRRDGRVVYTLEEVERERRTGYKWYGYEPADVITAYPAWQQRWSPTSSALEDR